MAQVLKGKPVVEALKESISEDISSIYNLQDESVVVSE